MIRKEEVKLVLLADGMIYLNYIYLSVCLCMLVGGHTCYSAHGGHDNLWELVLRDGTQFVRLEAFTHQAFTMA